MLEVLGSSDEILPLLAVELQQSGPVLDAPQEPVSSSARQLRAPAEEQHTHLEGSDTLASAALHSNGDQRLLKAGVEMKGAGSLQDLDSSGGSVSERLPTQSGDHLPGQALQDLDSSGGNALHSNGICQQQGESAETLLSVCIFGELQGTFSSLRNVHGCQELTEARGGAATAL